MKEPPKMLSTKDFMYISDILNITYCFIKKFDHYDNEINDEDIKALVSNITKGLKNQYNSLLEELNNG